MCSLTNRTSYCFKSLPHPKRSLNVNLSLCFLGYMLLLTLRVKSAQPNISQARSLSTGFAVANLRLVCLRRPLSLERKRTSARFAQVTRSHCPVFDSLLADLCQ